MNSVNDAEEKGKLVFEKLSQCINGNLEETISLDQNFSEGMYFVKVNHEQHQCTKPLLIVR